MKGHLTYSSSPMKWLGCHLLLRIKPQGLMSALQHPVPIVTTRLHTQPWTGF